MLMTIFNFGYIAMSIFNTMMFYLRSDLEHKFVVILYFLLWIVMYMAILGFINQQANNVRREVRYLHICFMWNSK